MKKGFLTKASRWCSSRHLRLELLVVRKRANSKSRTPLNSRLLMVPRTVTERSYLILMKRIGRVQGQSIPIPPKGMRRTCNHLGQLTCKRLWDKTLQRLLRIMQTLSGMGINWIIMRTLNKPWIALLKMLTNKHYNSSKIASIRHQDGAKMEFIQPHPPRHRPLDHSTELHLV